jgi:hypothetical protein
MMANMISENITDNSPQLKHKVHVKIEGTANDDKNREGVRDDKIKGKEGYDTLEGGDEKIKEARYDKVEGDQCNDEIVRGEGYDSVNF